MNRARVSLLLGVVTAITVLVGVSAVYPSLDDLWVDNPFWNGLSEFYVAAGPLRMPELNGLSSVLSPENTTLFVIGPSTEFSGDEVALIRVYLYRGGTVVLADDFGTGNQLLEGLRVGVRFSGGLLVDPLFRDRSPLMPIATATGYTGVGGLVFNHATALSGCEGAGVTVWSSPFSFLEAGGAQGPWPLVAELGFEGGRLLVVGDSSLFINSMIGRGGNRLLLDAFMRGEAIIDEAHSTPSRLTVVKGLLAKAYTGLGGLELRYSLVVAVVVGVMAFRLDDEVEPVDEVEAVMAAHPEYDRGLVEWMHAERRRARGE